MLDWGQCHKAGARLVTHRLVLDWGSGSPKDWYRGWGYPEAGSTTATGPRLPVGSSKGRHWNGVGVRLSRDWRGHLETMLDCRVYHVNTDYGVEQMMRVLDVGMQMMY